MPGSDLTPEQSQFIVRLPIPVLVNYVADMVSGELAVTPSTFYFSFEQKMQDVDPVAVFDLCQVLIRNEYMRLKSIKEDGEVDD